jgi:hypothetical protein
MSRGPGRIERAIIAAFAAEPDNAFTTDDLVERVYRGVNRIEKKHRVAVVRAAKNLSARSHSNLDWFRSEYLGGTLVFFDCCNVMSYAMARLKGDLLDHYRSNDRRISPWQVTSESDLRARLAEGGREHKLVIEGGAWWRHVQSWRAELDARRAGDTERIERVRAERKAHNAAILASFTRREMQ